MILYSTIISYSFLFHFLHNFLYFILLVTFLLGLVLVMICGKIALVIYNGITATLQTYHVYSTLKRRGNVCFTSFQREIHVVCL